ncbi:MAG: glutamyl-tRNA reductase [Actinomycetota bacterium]
MSIVVIGVNHRTGPVAFLEKVMISEANMPNALRTLSMRDDIREAVVLSTCNRTEIYAVVERFHGAYDEIQNFLCETSGFDADEVTPHLYSQWDDEAIKHLFEVASGLDSAVLGESEIIGQVRNAWEVAMAEGASRNTLNLLFRYALEVGKRARTETAISRSTASVSHAAVEMAEDIIGSLSGKHVLVVGAGEMGEGVATALARGGAEHVTVVNRTESRGEALAEKVGARVSKFENLETELSGADVVVACTGAGSTIINHDMLQRARNGIDSPLLIVDIALPRDVEDNVTKINGVTLRDLDHLSEWAQRGLEQRAAEVGQVRTIIEAEVERFAQDQVQRQAAPLVAQLREVVEGIRTAELERQGTRLSDMTEEQREAVDSITRGIVAKLLHTPSVRLREAAGTPQGERLSAAVRDLFNLE